MEGKDSSSDSVSKPVVAQVQVLHAPMVLRVLGDLDYEYRTSEVSLFCGHTKSVAVALLMLCL